MSDLPTSGLICAHDFYWSRRRQADVCRRCGAVSPVLALQFRSRSSWAADADRPCPPTPASTAPDPTGAISVPIPVAGPLDFSSRSAAPLQKPMVT